MSRIRSLHRSINTVHSIRNRASDVRVNTDEQRLFAVTSFGECHCLLMDLRLAHERKRDHGRHQQEVSLVTFVLT